MVHVMAAAGVVLYKTFTYRGNPEEWGNTYHFLGDAPSTPALWRALVDELIVLEKKVLGSQVTIDRAICYTNTDDASVYSYDLSAFGGTVIGWYDAASAGSVIQEGGSSYMCRWDTGRRSSSGKAIYLRKYWHPAMTLPGSPDALDTELITALGIFGAAVITPTGAWPGLAGPDGVAPVGHLGQTYANYRTLRKGRRRPT